MAFGGIKLMRLGGATGADETGAAAGRQSPSPLGRLVRVGVAAVMPGQHRVRDRPVGRPAGTCRSHRVRGKWHRRNLCRAQTLPDVMRRRPHAIKFYARQDHVSSAGRRLFQFRVAHVLSLQADFRRHDARLPARTAIGCTARAFTRRLHEGRGRLRQREGRLKRPATGPGTLAVRGRA